MGDTRQPHENRFDDEEASANTPLLKSRQRPDNTNGISSSAQHIEEEWTAEHNNKNPRNWTFTYKWATVALVSFIEFLTTMPNFMYAPNIADAQKELNSSDDTLATFSLTIYVLGFGLGPLLFAPLSELYGRAVIYRNCLSIFLICTAGCAISSSIGMLVAFRFAAGCFGAAPVAIGGAVVGDLFETNELGTAMSVYQAGQIAAAIVGPPFGGLVGSYASWRWIFWTVGILTVATLICTFVVFRETHAPTLKRKIYGKPEDDDSKRDETNNLASELRKALSRPLKLLTRSPVVFLSCLLIFLVIGFLNVFLVEMSRVFQLRYGMTVGRSSNVYFGLALGFVLASVIFGSSNDKIMQSLARRNMGATQPEFRLPATIIAMPVILIGILWYGWALHFRTHWIVPVIGSGFGGLGITTVQLSVTTYLVDSFDEFSASALAAITMARSVGGAVVPLSAPGLHERLGQGWGNSVFALVDTVCCAIPVLLYYYGARWRAVFNSDDL